MTKHPTPSHEGHFWAKLKLHDDLDLISADWEVVQVFENGGMCSGPEFYMASVPGIESGQSLDAFVCGPEVIRPADLI